MKKRDLEIAFRKAFLECAKSFELKEYSLLPAFDSQKKGRRDTGLYFYLNNLGSRGWQGRKYRGGDKAGHEEKQTFEYEVKLTALSSDRDDDPHDMAASALMVVQSLPFQTLLKNQNIGLQRPSKITAITFTNDSDNYEDEVFFTFNLSVNRLINPPTDVVKKFTINKLQV